MLLPKAGLGSAHEDTHWRQGVRDYKYSCGQCGYNTDQHYHYRRHLLTHTGEKPYQCDVCGNRFSQSGSMQHHKRTLHGGERRHLCHLCPQCGHTFTEARSLNRHIKSVHNKIKEYKCVICERCFSLKQGLDLHMMRHTAVYCHHCPHCNRGFGRPDHMRRHIARQHTSIAWSICPC